MGGYNSGRRDGKRTDDMHVFDIRKIQRAGLLKPGGIQLAVDAQRQQDCGHRHAHRV